jgi:hypothetical protein
MRDLTIAGNNVNAINKNKRVLFDRRAFGRRNSSSRAFEMKECFATFLAPDGALCPKD